MCEFSLFFAFDERVKKQSEGLLKDYRRITEGNTTNTIQPIQYNRNAEVIDTVEAKGSLDKIVPLLCIFEA